MANRRFQGRQRVSQRAPTSWAGACFEHIDLPADSKVILGSFVPLAGFAHETVVRVVGTWATNPTAIGCVAIGACVVTDRAFTAGIASMPDPITDIADDIWMFIDAVSAPAALATEQRRYDSRAMRRVEEGTRLVIIAAQTTAATVDFAVYMRVLAKQAVRG